MVTPEQIQSLVNLPVYGVLLMAVVALWKAYSAAMNARVEDLKQGYEKNLADLRTRVMLLEDRTGVLDAKGGMHGVPGANLN